MDKPILLGEDILFANSSLNIKSNTSKTWYGYRFNIQAESKGVSCSSYVTKFAFSLPTKGKILYESFPHINEDLKNCMVKHYEYDQLLDRISKEY